jgi:hypothetical protein
VLDSKFINIDKINYLSPQSHMQLIQFERKKVLSKKHYLKVVICVNCMSSINSLMEFDVEERLRMKTFFNKRGKFKLVIVNFPFICCKIPTYSVNGVYVFQLADILDMNCLDIGFLLTRKLLSQVEVITS